VEYCIWYRPYGRTLAFDIGHAGRTPALCIGHPGHTLERFYADDTFVNLYIDDLLIAAERDGLRTVVKAKRARFSTNGGVCGASFEYISTDEMLADFFF